MAEKGRFVAANGIHPANSLLGTSLAYTPYAPEGVIRA